MSQQVVTAMHRAFGRIPELEGRTLTDLVGRSFVFTVIESTNGLPEGYISQILGIKWVRNCCILKIHQTTIFGKVCTGIVHKNGAWHAKHGDDTYIPGDLLIP